MAKALAPSCWDPFAKNIADSYLASAHAVEEATGCFGRFIFLDLWVHLLGYIALFVTLGMFNTLFARVCSHCDAADLLRPKGRHCL